MRARVLTVFGTRPEAVKMAPVVQGLAADPRFDSVVCVTAQHRELLDSVLELFEIRPDVDLDVMRAGQDLFDVTARVLTRMRDVLTSVKPDAVLVHGDTTTCLAAGLAAFYTGLPVGHVEAGLRSGDLRAPFPEEANRVLVDRVSRWLFAPTGTARTALEAEGVDPGRVVVTGNTGIDALLGMRARVRDADPRSLGLDPAVAAACAQPGTRKVLVTAHRRESFGAPLRELFGAIARSADQHPDWLFIVPVHPNPNVREAADELLAGHANVCRTKPVDYAPFVWLMDRADVLLTDSGGLQEEGPALAKPVLVARDTTERPEAVEAGVARLVGTDETRIRAALEELLGDEEAYAAMAKGASPFGDGHATERILERLARDLETTAAATAA